MSKTILMVEDDCVAARVYGDYLRKLGYEVLWAQEGPSALRLAAKPDGALLDLLLPGMSGLNVLKLLRVKRPKMPVVVYTNVFTPSLVDEVTDAGATCTLNKADLTAHGLAEVFDKVLR
jgi:DNA-binding response OmpR family regulator